MDNSFLGAAVLIAGLSLTAGLFLLLILIFLGFLALLVYLASVFFWRGRKAPQRTLVRVEDNPILSPIPGHWWESEAVFNPGAFVFDGRVHLLYRALGGDGVSRIGYASSKDGIHFDVRLPYPVFDCGAGHIPVPNGKRVYRPLSYNTDLYASGGGWGGSEDPRAVVMDTEVYMTFGIFESWQSMRMAVTSVPAEDLAAHMFMWKRHIPMSPPQETHKNWVLFPEKIRGKYAILHALTPEVKIEYVTELEHLGEKPIQSNNHRTGRPGHWDAFVRGAAAPPIKTELGWLLLYHGMDPKQPEVGYRVGAMLLDLEQPEKILYRSQSPILEPKEWYENDWKPGVVYASGAVVFNGDLFVYYGGGDKYVAAAKINLKEFIHSLTTGSQAQFSSIAGILS